MSNPTTTADWTCRQCGKHLGNTAYYDSTGVGPYCAVCIESRQRTTVFSTGWICPRCGAVMAPTQAFCVNCSPAPQITC